MASSSLPPLPLPGGISEIYVKCPTNGLTFHVLEAGQRGQPLLLLVHGYPDLAFSWRKVMIPLANEGYYVVAFDQRGFGRTTGWDTSPYAETDVSQFALTNIVRDTLTLVNALGYSEVKCIVGHDSGAVTASHSALMRPDFFKSLLMMSHPFKMPERLPFNIAHGDGQPPKPPVDIQAELANLDVPRKHYKWYNSTPDAADHWANPPQGLHAFLRGYLHVKSADWKENTPHPLKAWTADELAKMPHYYIMPLDKTLPDTIAAMMADEDTSNITPWLSPADLDVYVQEWRRTGFQGGLNFYRVRTTPGLGTDMELFAGKKIECPSIFVSGMQDWGNYQEPGAIEECEESCAQFRGSRFIDGAGHWPQLEKPKRVVEEVLAFLETL